MYGVNIRKYDTGISISNSRFAFDSGFIYISYFTTRRGMHKVLVLVLSVTFLFVYEISRELLNGYAPNSQGRRV